MKTKIILYVCAVIFAMMSAHLVWADPVQTHPLLKKFETEGGIIKYLGNAYGLEGWSVLSPKGDAQYVYITPEGGLVVGMLFSPEGLLETQKQLEALKQRMDGSQAAVPGADKSTSKSEKLYAETEKAGWVAFGDATAPYLYMFMNVNCDHCQAMWKDLEPAVKAGKLQVRLIPFGKSPANRDGGAALLSIEKKEEAWRAYVGGDKTALALDKVKLSTEAYGIVDKNTALTDAWKLPSTPFTLYRRPLDGRVIALTGRPENTMLLMADFLK